MVHRDIAPKNIFLSGDLTKIASVVAKLGDFGLAFDVKSSKVTEASLKGTMQYFSPEMLQGKGGGMPSDMWAVGITIYEMLSGTCPFADIMAKFNGRYA